MNSAEGTERTVEHTKGPWRSVYLPGSSQRCAAVESPSEGVYIYLNVAKHDDMDATIERWKHDALLIAAAPDLLEALKGVLPYMEQAESKLLVGHEGCHWPVELVRAAIAKSMAKS